MDSNLIQVPLKSSNGGSIDVTEQMIALEQQGVEIPEIHGEEPRLQSVDFILAYLETGNSCHEQKREEFETELRDQGLELEYEHNGHLCFVKIHAPQEVLCRYCEIMKIKMPIKGLTDQELKDSETDIFDDARSCFIRMFSFVQLNPEKFPKKERNLLAEYSRDKAYLFDVENENFFPVNIRLMIVDFILERQCVGIQRLLAAGVYTAAYPLHDGTYKQKGSTRALLYQEWGAMSKMLNLQPLDTVKEYFGVSYAIYFAWLGYYTHMLIPASIFGLVCFLYGLITLWNNQIATDVCSDWAHHVIMCPQCDKCDYWRLQDVCNYTRFSLLFDNESIVIFAVFMSIWAAVYLELWRRKSEELMYRWGMVGWDQGAEHPRPQYLALLAKWKVLKAKVKINAVTMKKELYVSYWKVRLPATVLSFSVVIFFLSTAIATVFAVVFYRMVMIGTLHLFGKADDDPTDTYALSATAAAINLVGILLLNYFYDWLAAYLTELEMRRTQTEFDNSLTFKIYVFQFVNYYASIFYVAFLKGKYVGYPRNYHLIFGYRQEECGPGGCLMELCIQLAIIMVGKQALSTAVEMVLPVLMKWWAFFRVHCGLKQKDSHAPRNQWIRDFKLLDWGPRGLYDEYLELVIQFGFVTLFVVAFPLAPFFALLNNVLEMRLDATKFLRHYRRPVPRRARDIGVWKQIMDALARISIITNAVIIAFSSNLIPRLVYMDVVSPNKTDVGFLNHSLAYSDTIDFTVPHNSPFKNVTECRYSDYRNPPNHPAPYDPSPIYWRILAVRLVFIVVFQTFVSLMAMVIQWCMSGLPRRLGESIKREAYQTEQIIIRREAERARKKSRLASRLLDTAEDLRRRRLSPVVIV